MPFDDTPIVVPVGYEPVDIKPLSGENMVVAASSTLPICVDKGVQTKIFLIILYRCLWRRGSSTANFVITVVGSVGAAVRMDKGRYGRVH